MTEHPMNGIERMRKLLEEATERPWVVLKDLGYSTFDVHGADSPATVLSISVPEASAALIVQAVNAAEAFVEVAEAMQRCCEETDYCYVCDNHPSHGHASTCALEQLAQEER
jgi:hypothetical protein